MGVMRRVQQRKKVSLATVTAVAIAFLLFASTTTSAFFVLHPTRRLGVEVTEEGERVAKSNSNSPSESEDNLDRVATIQRRLNGPGSAPPKCIGKCGSCKPCQPVRVVIQPGFSTPLEYYPIAWRCKCGNKLFMP